jgi:hypothetical protein
MQSYRKDPHRAHDGEYLDGDRIRIHLRPPLCLGVPKWSANKDERTRVGQPRQMKL